MTEAAKEGEVLPAKSSCPIVEYRPLDSAIATLRDRHSGALFDFTKSGEMQRALEARRELRSYRVKLEETRKAVKADLLVRTRQIDGEARRIQTALEELEDPIHAQIQKEEQRKSEERAARERAENERIERIQSRIFEIGNVPSDCMGRTAAEMAVELAKLQELTIAQTDYHEFTDRAEMARAKAVAMLTRLHSGAVAEEQRTEQERIAKAAEDAARIARSREEAERQQREHQELARRKAELEAEEIRLAAERASIAEERARARERADAEERERREQAAAEQAAARRQRDIEEAAEQERRAEQRRVEEEAARQQREAEAVERAHLREEQERLEAERLALAKERAQVVEAEALLGMFRERFGKRKEFSKIIKAIQDYFTPKKALAE